MFRVKQDFDPETMQVKLELSLVHEDNTPFLEAYKGGFAHDVKLIDGKFMISLLPNSIVKINGEK